MKRAHRRNGIGGHGPPRRHAEAEPAAHNPLGSIRLHYDGLFGTPNKQPGRECTKWSIHSQSCVARIPLASDRVTLRSTDRPPGLRGAFPCPTTIPRLSAILRQSHDTTLLTDREKHLVGLAVTLTRGCQVCTRNRIEKAREADIGDNVLNALVRVVSSVNAGVTAATAREGFRLADASASDSPCTDVCAAEGGQG